MTTNKPIPLSSLTFQQLTASEAREIRPAVQEIYENSYVEAIATGDPFRAPAEFMRRFDSYTASGSSGFSMVIVRLGDNPIGQSWGWPLSTKSQWWTGLELDEADDTFTLEDGTRTFAFSELMVRIEHTGQGVARQLHNQLLSSRPEQRATLLVNPPNTRAYSTYLRWGWYRVGALRPSWPDAPRFHVLIHDLPLT